MMKIYWVFGPYQVFRSDVYSVSKDVPKRAEGLSIAYSRNLPNTYYSRGCANIVDHLHRRGYLDDFSACRIDVCLLVRHSTIIERKADDIDHV